MSYRESFVMSVANKSIFQKTVSFFAEVRQEVSRVVWPTRKETTLLTLVVFIFVVIAAIYFIIADWVAFKILNLILGIVA